MESFIKRQNSMYETALGELKAGRKESCWMWYIFPQLRGLARSRKSFVYGIKDLQEAAEYLNHPLLGSRLKECCEALLTHTDKTACEILGETDAGKLRACMTLFSLAGGEKTVFGQVLDRFFAGRRDSFTLGLAAGTIKDMTFRKFLTGAE